MSLSDRLRALVAAAPPSATVPVSWIADVLEQETAGAGADVTADLRLEDVAAQLERAVSTVRTWCQQQRIPGAYRLRGREWRIPRKGLQAFLDAEQRGDASAGPAGPSLPVRRSRGRASTPTKPVSLGSWRKVRRANGA